MLSYNLCCSFLLSNWLWTVFYPGYNQWTIISIIIRKDSRLHKEPMLIWLISRVTDNPGPLKENKIYNRVQRFWPFLTKWSLPHRGQMWNGNLGHMNKYVCRVLSDFGFTVSKKCYCKEIFNSEFDIGSTKRKIWCWVGIRFKKMQKHSPQKLLLTILKSQKLNIFL